MYIAGMFDVIWPEADSINRIEEKGATKTVSLDNWPFEKFDYIDIDKYNKIGEGVIHLGDMWDIDGTYFFTRQVEIPKTEEKTDWFLDFNIGGECEVYVDDVAVGSLDTFHDSIMIAHDTLGGNTVNVKIQATRHAHDYVRLKRWTGNDYGPHIFRSVKLVAKDKECMDFVGLINAILKLLECDTLPRDLHSRIHGILKDVLYEIDCFADLSTFKGQLAEAKKMLLEKIHALDVDNIFGNCIFMGHSHLDLAFKWTYKETHRKVERTLSNTAAIFDRFPEGVYVQSQMNIIETLAESYPQLFERIKKLASEGRVSAVGDTYVEFDTNIPSGESIIRQFLIGRRLAQQYMNSKSKVCFLPDTFGYTGILPQILKQAEFDYFVTAKLSWNDTNKPKDLSFLWTGIDGSSVKTHLIDSYAGGTDYTRMNTRRKDERTKTMPNGDRHICQYGAGDGGGGVNENNMRHMLAQKELKVFNTVHHMSLDDACDYVFEGVTDEQLPVRNGELYFEKHRGVYTSQEKIKKGNRKLELALKGTEALNALSYLKGKPYYDKVFDGVWKKLLLNQFHDIIAGSCIPGVVEDAHNDYVSGLDTCKDIINKVLVDNNATGDVITLFNPNGFYTGGPVEVDLPYAVDTLEGKPVQMISENKAILDIDSIAPFGVKKVTLGKKITFGKASEKETDVLENSRYLIKFDNLGEITSIFNKALDKEILRGKGNFLCGYVDRGGYFESWDITSDFERKVYNINDVESMVLTEDGPVRKTMRIVKKFRNSEFVQNISIYENSPRIDFDTAVDFNEQQMLVKAGFRVDVDAPLATFDISMGDIKRETTRNDSFEKAKFEVSNHKFFDLSDDTHGVAVLNDCKYGCDVRDNVMRLTLIKSATFPDPDQGIGKAEFKYSLLPHNGDVYEAKVREEAYRFNLPVYSMVGDLDFPESPVSCDEPGIMLETLKKAENEDAIILRMYEHFGKECEASINWSLPMSKVTKCTVLEKEMDSSDVVCDGGKIKLKVKPFEIVSLKIEK